MKATALFKTKIKDYLDKRAEEDALFRAKYETTTRTIDDIATYIINTAFASGCNGFDDIEIYSMAVHVIDEPNLEIGKPINCRVVINHHVDLTEEEKAQQREIALKRFQDEELRKLQARNSKPKAQKAQTENASMPSLFDGF